MAVTTELEEIVMTGIELVREEEACEGREEIIAVFLKYFPEHEDAIRSYLTAMESELKDSEVRAARMQRDYLESRWV